MLKNLLNWGGADVAGFFNYELNIIAVDYSTVKRDSEKYGLNEKIHAMLLVFHEYVHSFSASSLDAQSFESRPFFAQVSESRVGYEKKKTVITKEGEREEKIMSEQDFWYLNEALTEGLAYNILSEYAKRTGSFSNVDLAQYEQSLVENRVTDYPYIVGSVKAMCSIVGKKIGIDGGIVWNSLVRGIFKNGTIETEEIKNYFTETFDNKFLPRLSKIKTVEEMVVFLKDYKV